MGWTKNKAGLERIQERAVCIFDAGLPLSREHIYPRWMRDHFPPNDRTEHLVSMTLFNSDSPTRRASRTVLQGDHRGRRIRCVCEACNNGWMSRLQSRAKPVLEPLVLGEYAQIESPAKIVLAAWATMFAAVWEYTHPPTIAITQNQRRALMNDMLPGELFGVWIAPFAGEPLKTNHRGAYVIPPGGDEPPDNPGCNVQFTLLSPGAVCFLVFSATEQATYDLCNPGVSLVAKEIGFQLLWPADDTAIFVKESGKEAFTKDDFEWIIEAVTEGAADVPGQFELDKYIADGS
jgi:hypothetical protein